MSNKEIKSEIEVPLSKKKKKKKSVLALSLFISLYNPNIKMSTG